MNPIYYESVVLATIAKLKRDGEAVGHKNLVQAAMLGNKTIIAALKRLERKGRLTVIRPGDGLPHDYEILSPPNEMERSTLAIHLAGKQEIEQVACFRRGEERRYDR